MMMKSKILFLIFFIKTFDKIEANEVACESVQDRFWYNSPVGTVKTCFMEDTTSINQRGFTILSSDDSVQGLRFTGNEKILFLPVQVGANFPNLLAYAARGCSIKIITKTNFEGLSKLRSLFLWYNEIEKISSDTFKDLKDLELLWLDNNKIKFINGATFHGLNKLKEVDLNTNVCISKKFYNHALMRQLQQNVNEKCGFDEPAATPPVTIKPDDKIKALEVSLLKLITQLESKSKIQISTLEKNLSAKSNELLAKFQRNQELQRQISSLKQSNSKLKSELKNCKLSKSQCEANILERNKTIQNCTSENVALKTQLKDEKSQHQQQLNLIQEFQQKHELQWNAAKTSRTKFRDDKDMRNCLCF